MSFEDKLKYAIIMIIVFLLILVTIPYYYQSIKADSSQAQVQSKWGCLNLTIDKHTQKVRNDFFDKIIGYHVRECE
jgi:uncharacterized protein YpmB